MIRKKYSPETLSLKIILAKELLMKKKQYIILTRTLLSFIFIFALFSCVKTDSAKDKTLNIYVPSAPPALPLYKSAQSQQNLSIISYSSVASEAVPAIIRREKALFVIPTNTAATLYNKNEDLVIVGILSRGLLSLMSSEPGESSILDLRNKDIYIPAPGSSPDVIARYLFKREGVTPQIHYSSSPEIAKLIISGRIQRAVLPEPLASLAAAKSSGTVRKIADLSATWKSVNRGSKGIPQVALCCSGTFYKEHQREIKNLSESLTASVTWVNANPREAGEFGARSGGLKIPAAIIEMSIPSMNITWQKASDEKEDIESYLNALYEMDPKTTGGSLPDSGLYAF
jgi:NitT/TauT family transport system substrate-binding protein